MRRNADDVWTCDVCGRLTNRHKDAGYHIAQTGGYACTSCHQWAEHLNLTCPTCKGTLAHGSYESKCSCDTRPRVTRNGRHYEVKEG